METKQIEAAVAQAMATSGNIEGLLQVAPSVFGWSKEDVEYATTTAARQLDEADLAAVRTRLAEHMVGFEFDGEKYRVVARVELNTKSTTTPSTNGNGGKGRPGQLIRKDGSVVGTYTAIAKACAAVGIKEKGQNGKALLAKLAKAGYTYQE